MTPTEPMSQERRRGMEHVAGVWKQQAEPKNAAAYTLACMVIDCVREIERLEEQDVALQSLYDDAIDALRLGDAALRIAAEAEAKFFDITGKLRPAYIAECLRQWRERAREELDA